MTGLNHRDTNIKSAFFCQVQRRAYKVKITRTPFRCFLLFRYSEIITRYYYLLALSQSLDSEAPRQSPEAAAPAPSWPQQGEITFQDVNMRYRDDLPLVLKSLSFTILPEETIGIVGRTGSGTADLLCSRTPAAFQLPFKSLLPRVHIC